MLRRLEEQACHQAFPFDQASDRDFPRARGGLELVLHRRAHAGAWMNEAAASAEVAVAMRGRAGQAR